MKRAEHRSQVFSTGVFAFSLTLGLFFSVAAPSHLHAQPAVRQTTEPPKSRIVALTTLMTQFVAGVLTPKNAWQRGLLSIDDLYYVLGTPGPIDRQANEEIRLALAGLLVTHGAQRLDAAPTISPVVKLRLADYYRSIRDPFAIELYEELLVGAPGAQAPLPYLLKDTPLRHLALFYQETGEQEKSVQTRLRAIEYFAANPSLVAGNLLEAARLCKQMGEEPKAQELYAQIPAYGYDWYTALVAGDLSRELIAAGKPEEGKQLLLASVRKMARTGGRAMVYAFLAFLEHNQGNLENAFKHSALALADFNALRPDRRWNSIAEATRELHVQSGGWKTQPVHVEAATLNIKFNSTERPAIGRLRVASYGDKQIQVTCDNPLLKVRLAPLNGWDDTPVGNGSWDREVITEIAPDALAQASKQPLQATLTVSSAGRTALARKVPVVVFKAPFVAHKP